MCLINGSFGFSTTEKEAILAFVPVITMEVLSTSANSLHSKFCFGCEMKQLPFEIRVINEFYFCQLSRYYGGLAQILVSWIQVSDLPFTSHSG